MLGYIYIYIIVWVGLDYIYLYIYNWGYVRYDNWLFRLQIEELLLLSDRLPNLKELVFYEKRENREAPELFYDPLLFPKLRKLRIKSP